MKRNEVDLLHRYLDGAITPEEFESLEGLLRGSAESRSTLRSLATIDAKWQQLAAEEVLGKTSEPTTLSRDKTAATRKPAASVADSVGSRRLTPLGLMATALAMTLHDVEWFYTFVDDQYAQGRNPASSTQALREVLYSNDHDGGDLGVFTSFLFTHNAQVGIMAFALGFAAGLPVYILLFMNGMILGAPNAPTTPICTVMLSVPPARFARSMSVRTASSGACEPSTSGRR